MKKRLWSLILVMVLVSMTMTGCRQAMQSAGMAANQGAEAAGDAMTQSLGTADPVLTPEEAQKIALKHAGLSEDLVIGLHAQYEIEHGAPIYDVEFRHRMWEYDYEIHADTGEILAFSKDE